VTRVFAMGDPQAPFAKVTEVLARHGALDGEWLASDVTLVSIGDHFDYDHKNPEPAGREGVRILHWLADHDEDQVHLLIGNHDVSRVMELVTLDDAAFQSARAFARDVDAGTRTAADYAAAFPGLPPHGVIARDYSSYTDEQRELVMELLLSGRFHLALVGVLADGREALVTHAGITSRELAMLGIPDERDPTTIARTLDAVLVERVQRVADAWKRGMRVPLDLHPLHVAGTTGEEGGGLLYQRPTNPDRPGADRRWELAPARPRRFDPRTLPIGLVQVAGHSGHNKCLEELGGWATDLARGRKHGGIRTLRVSETQVIYDLGVLPPAPNTADLILIDGELRRLPSEDVALLPMKRVSRADTAARQGRNAPGFQ
jgi:hypothetical protein